MKVLFLPDTVLRLKNLTSHTRYLVSISAFNAAGDGPKSDPRQGRTHQAGRCPRFLGLCCTRLRRAARPFLSVHTAPYSACPVRLGP